MDSQTSGTRKRTRGRRVIRIRRRQLLICANARESVYLPSARSRASNRAVSTKSPLKVSERVPPVQTQYSRESLAVPLAGAVSTVWMGMPIAEVGAYRTGQSRRQRRLCLRPALSRRSAACRPACHIVRTCWNSSSTGNGEQKANTGLEFQEWAASEHREHGSVWQARFATNARRLFRHRITLASISAPVVRRRRHRRGESICRSCSARAGPASSWRRICRPYFRAG